MLRNALIVFLLTVFPLVAAAQDSSSDERARLAFDSGSVAFDEGRYDDAMENFTRAYDLSHRPELLYNIGLSADRLRHDAEALRAFESYLESLPEAENRPEVERRMRALRAAIAAEAATAIVVTEPEAEPVVADAGRPIYEEWWLWTAIGLGVALAVAIPVGVHLGSSGAPDPFVTGDIGPGGIVIALEGP
jgi:tetratricopeptide (TPR) repeat protein